MTKLDKEGWEIIKLGEAFTLQMGRTPARDNSSYWGGSNRWIAISDLRDSKMTGVTKECITDTALAESNIPIIPAGTTIMSFKLTIGKTAITSEPICTNEAIMAFLPKESTKVLPDYLYYVLPAQKWEGNRAVMGKTINKKIISEHSIPLPPLPIQQRIVEELDEINAIISAKKQQLKELDELAQSIFYTMFGDPVTNEKGWEVKKLGEVCTLSQGLAINRQTKQLLVAKSTLPLLRIKDLKEGTREVFVNDKDFPHNCLANEDDIIYTRTGTLGLSFTGVYGIVHNNCFKIHIKDNLNKVFFMNYINGSWFKDAIINLASRSSQPDITHKLFLSRTIPLPPLPLQETFAARVSAIEEEKAAIAASIEKMQTLLDARMQEYFG